MCLNTLIVLFKFFHSEQKSFNSNWRSFNVNVDKNGEIISNTRFKTVGGKYCLNDLGNI